MKLIYLGKTRTTIAIAGRDKPISLLPNATVDLPPEMPFVKRGLANGLFKKSEMVSVKSSGKKLATKEGSD